MLTMFVPMESLFSDDDVQEIRARLQKLNSSAKARWGKMSAAQMLVHCQKQLQVALGEMSLKRGLFSFFFGKRAKKKLLSKEPFAHNLPTADEFVVQDNSGDFEKEKQTLSDMILRFQKKGPKAVDGKIHPFFGTMEAGEWDILCWKHLDHHFRQFGV